MEQGQKKGRKQSAQVHLSLMGDNAAVLKVTHYCCEWHEENSSQRKIKTVRCFLFVAHFPPAGPCIVTGQGDRVEAICSPLKEPQTVKSLTRRCECPLLHPLTSRVFMGVIILARFRGSSHFDTQDEWQPLAVEKGAMRRQTKSSVGTKRSSEGSFSGMFIGGRTTFVCFFLNLSFFLFLSSVPQR